MSAFEVSTKHINLIATALSDVKIIDSQSRQMVASLLLKENLKSLNARYPKSAYKDIDAIANFHKYNKVRHNFAQVYLLVECYEYQSCEHDTWKESKAYKLCQDLKKHILETNKKGYTTYELLQRSSEYQKASWTI